jgi:ABC-type transport system involved in multi-copper enzyme maturation permease subunit
MPIFDQGYQHWKGDLSGHGWRWLVVMRQGLRGQLKGWAPRLLLMAAWAPAAVLVAAICLWGLFEQKNKWIVDLVKPIVPASVSVDPHVYRQAVWTIAYSTFFQTEIFFIMLLVVLIGPNLISRDLRFNAFPLYFSRPLTRFDYFLGKLGVIATLVAAVAILPALAAYVLGVCFSLDLGVIRDTWRLPLASALYGLLIVVSVGTLMLALSSLSRRSLYVSIAWVGFWIVSSTVSSVLVGIQRGTVAFAVAQEMAKDTVQAEQPEGDRPQQEKQPGADAAERQRPPRMDPKWLLIQERIEREMAKAAPTNWRPVCSYTANLHRLGEALLNTDAAWVQIGNAIETPRSTFMKTLFARKDASKPAASTAPNRRFADQYVPQYPWTWSAGVLAGLLGISLWILSTRVKSLDRLR